MAAWEYEFYLLVLKVSLTSEQSERVRQRNTCRRAFRQKRDIFTCENNMLSLHVKILRLLWLLGKLHLGQQKILKSNFICGYIINETLHGHLEMQISVLLLKILYRYTAM